MFLKKIDMHFYVYGQCCVCDMISVNEILSKRKVLLQI